VSSGDHPRDLPEPGYETELRRHDAVLRRHWGVRVGDHVLDVGCGTGQTTRAAAAAAPLGSVLGVDVSSSAIERARGLAAAEGLGNVAFECGDAQTHPLRRSGYDLAISRFGTMFFDEPVAAFAHIAQALRPAGRLVMLVWQTGDRNEWDVTLNRALGVSPAVPSPAFTLGDAHRTTQVLGAAGFVDVALTDVDEPVCYGPHVEAALDWVGRFASTREAMERLGRAGVADATSRLRALLAAHQGDDGVWFASRSWLVTARRA
jgi:SAM-dependent methyltransferase